jgi:hypothetical protein
MIHSCLQDKKFAPRLPLRNGANPDAQIQLKPRWSGLDEQKHDSQECQMRRDALVFQDLNSPSVDYEDLGRAV